MAGEFVIAPHMRLHEWVAVEKGYFDDEGLVYALEDQLKSATNHVHDLGDKVGAYQTFEKGRTSDVSCACHWTVNVAAASGHGRLYGKAYSVSPCGIFVPADSDIRTPEDLANVPISVGYQSGSHYSTIQALEPFLSDDEINLSYSDGLLFRRMEHLIDGNVPAVSLFSGPYYFMQQLGFRKVLDTSFMMAAMVAEEQFGPALPIMPFDTEGEAIRRANDSRYGLCSSVWTEDRDRALSISRQLEAGYTYLNGHGPTAQDFRGPFGGFKDSGFGRNLGYEGVVQFQGYHSISSVPGWLL